MKEPFLITELELLPDLFVALIPRESEKNWSKHLDKILITMMLYKVTHFYGVTFSLSRHQEVDIYNLYDIIVN
jgi:hypothetical protein